MILTLRHVRYSLDLLLAVCMTTCPLWCQVVQPISPGNIPGKLLSATDRSPVAGATITLRSLAPANPFLTRVISAKDGAFALSAVPEGRFALCATAATSAFADSCVWGQTQTILEVAKGAPSGQIVVRLMKSSLVQVRLNDANGYLAKQPVDKAPPHVLVGVWDRSGRFNPAREVKKDGNGITYELQVPADTPLDLKVYSRAVKLADQNNVPVPQQGYSMTVVHDSTKPPPAALVFSALGRNP